MQAARPAHPMTATVFQIRIAATTLHFEADAELTLLEAAAFAGIRLPRSCRNGTCRTCLCQLIEGQIEYRIEWPGVSTEEKAQGMILPCVAAARSDLVLSYPEQAFED
jgi:ferredoxin